MTEALVSLRIELEERDRLLGFACRLDDLKSEGSLSAADYETGRADYAGRIAAATTRIQTLKSALTKELEASEREGEMCRLKLEGAEAHHRAGQLSDTEYRAEERRWNAQQRDADRRCADLQIALAAESAADLGDIGVEAPAEQLPVTPARVKKAKQTQSRMTSAPASSTPSRNWTRLRIAALVVAVLLLVSVRLAWLAPAAALGTDLGSEVGVSVSFIAGIAGILCGFAAVGVSFVKASRTRGMAQVAAGLIAAAALVAAIFMGELPLLDTYFRELVVVREGLFAYTIAAVGLAILGFTQARRYA